MVLEVVGESFVQPYVCPPFRTDQVSEPLMRELVSYNGRYALLRASRSDAILVKKRRLPKIRSFD